MTPEMERLLGGYATDSLTEEERKLLYQAALEDQALFNALEDEQALRELLAHAESRREVVRALRPSASKTHSWWIWGLGAATVAATLLILPFVNRPRPTVQLAAKVRDATVQAPLPPAAQPTSTPRRALAPRKKAKAAPALADETALPSAPATAPASGKEALNQPASVSVEAAAPALNLESARAPKAMSAGALRSAAPPGIPLQILRDGAELKPSDLLRPGDSVQIKLRPPLTGTFTLSELATDGAWKTLPADVPIVVDVLKTIRAEWIQLPTGGTVTTVLTLSPGNPVQSH